ncbi:MAG: Methionine aminopeptidase [candidate division TM6 bacterium GW2011_GWF2_37_49]|nr:MAG: Methionine aminopeptidase [candidate division TM6 bacterium GW2011_GWF2_37_49]
MLVKSKNMIEKMRFAGKLLAQVMAEVDYCLKPGADTLEIDGIIENKMCALGLKPECKGYAGYRHATCISVNDGIIHGVPSKDVILNSGDFVKIDVVGSIKGYCADITRYFFIENVSSDVKKIANAAQEALDMAIEMAVPGNMVSDISASVQNCIESKGYSVIRDFAGHGIGKNLHEKPDIPNYRRRSGDFVLLEGMTLAIEPMIAQGSYEVLILDDGWTAKTADGKLAAHVEDTIVVLKGGAEILTRI